MEANGQGVVKSRTFFERAAKVAATKNYDYAIQMYLEGIKCAPEMLKGHLKLREMALVRREDGGKKPSMMEKVKFMRGKDSLEQLLNAEYLYSKDADNLSYAEAMVKSAVKCDFKNVGQWIADIVFAANNASKKPSASIYLMLKTAYAEIHLFERAIAACQRAVQLKPEDGDLADELNRLSAELTVARGRYDEEGDFRKAIKNRESQERLHKSDNLIKSKEVRLSAVEQAKREYKQSPEEARTINNLADSLFETGVDKNENDAIKLLEYSFRKQSDFSYKQRAGQYLIKKLKRQVRAARAKVEASPDDMDAKGVLNEVLKKFNAAELEHYGLCVENYPTDVGMKFEYGIRLFRVGSFDDAIPMFQEAQRDPKHRVAAMSKIGQCFFEKGWYPDAIDIFKEAVEGYDVTDDGVAKELKYSLAKAYDKEGEKKEALEIYRKLAQQDFGYKDVREQVNRLRKELG